MQADEPVLLARVAEDYCDLGTCGSPAGHSARLARPTLGLAARPAVHGWVQEGPDATA